MVEKCVGVESFQFVQNESCETPPPSSSVPPEMPRAVTLSDLIDSSTIKASVLFAVGKVWLEIYARNVKTLE